MSKDKDKRIAELERRIEDGNRGYKRLLSERDDLSRRLERNEILLDFALEKYNMLRIENESIRQHIENMWRSPNWRVDDVQE